MEALTAGMDPLGVVVECLKAMEASERFNAGRGSALQADGLARLTAAIMDGDRQSFSGVISAQYLTHPSELALELQSHSARVLTNPGAELLARKLALPLADNLTTDRLKNWVEKAERGEGLSDTVGCIIRTTDGRLVAGASTGGRGHEFPGRVSDSATVAGTYCSAYAAVCATGVGEEIVDDAFCARLETRVRDGMSLAKASQLGLTEAQSRSRHYGWIALDAEGGWSVATTTKAMSYVVFDVNDLQHFSGMSDAPRN
jgi:L-asparaginase